MNDPQELSSIDELFRNTLENMPEAPDASGWDTPSEKVWQQVQHQIAAPQKGPGFQTIATVALTTIGIALALYFAFKPAPQTVPSSPEAQPSQVETTVTPTGNETVATPETIDSQAVKPESDPKATNKSKAVKKAKTKETQVEVNHHGDVVKPGGAAPLPTPKEKQ